MNRKTLIAFASFIVLGIGALLTLRQPEKGERASDRPRPLPQLDAAQFDTIEVTKAGAVTVIKRDAGKYKVVQPVAYPADEAMAKAAFEGLAKMDVSSLVTEQKDKQAEFEVDDKGNRIVVKSGDKVLADFIIGKAMGALTMMRVSGKDQIWRLSGVQRYTFDRSPSDWRDKSITTFTAADAEQIEVAGKDGSRVVLKKTNEKVGSDDKWEVAEAKPAIDKLDNSIPNGIIGAMASLKASDFADSVKLADAGLEPAALTVTVGLKGGKKAVVLVGGKKTDDDVYVKTPEAPQVFLSKKYNIERVNKRPIDFRDKTLCDLADSALTEIAVTHGNDSYTVVKSGSDWKATKPAKLELDTSKITPVAGAFKEWKAASFSEETAPATTGLAKPPAVIAVKGKDKGAACTVKVGETTKDKLNYYVSIPRIPEVLLAPKWSVDRILVKVDDLKKAGAVAAKK
jgi:hypothetical protein